MEIPKSAIVMVPVPVRKNFIKTYDKVPVYTVTTVPVPSLSDDANVDNRKNFNDLVSLVAGVAIVVIGIRGH